MTSPIGPSAIRQDLNSLWRADCKFRFCFASGAAPQAKSLPTQVGITRGYGLSPEAALKSLTVDTVEVLGVSDSVGSLQTGKAANVIVTDGDPLQIGSHLPYLLIGGKPVALDSHHTHLYEKSQQRMFPSSISSPAISRSGAVSAQR